MQDGADKRMNLIGWLATGSRRGLPIVVAGLLAIGAAGAYALTVTAGSRTSTPFVLSAAPAQQTIRAGSVARFKVQVRPGTYSGPFKLSLTGLPKHVRASFTAAAVVQTLTLTTASNTQTGTYTLTVQVQGGGHTTTLPLQLTIQLHSPVPFVISGKVNQLAPGVPVPINLRLTNESPVKVLVTRLTVNATSVSAPQSTAALPCTLRDFSMQQFSGTYPLELPASSTTTLSSLGVPTAKRPQVTLVNRRLNQNGCQQARVSLTYAGQGSAG
jgi:hypothetical protein